MRQQEKQEQIITAAIKRLSYFGVHKTSLAEIADDLAMTKQSIHYYFSDKQTLIKAVLEYIANEYIESLRKHLALAANFEEALQQLIDTRYKYFSKYHMILTELMLSDSAKAPDLFNLKEYLHLQERILLTAAFNDALSHHEVKPADGNMIVELVQDTLDVFWQSVKGCIIDENQFTIIMERQKKLIGLMYKGIAA